MKKYIISVATYNWDSKQNCYMMVSSMCDPLLVDFNVCDSAKQVGSDESYVVTTYTPISAKEWVECWNDAERIIDLVEVPYALTWEQIQKLL